MKQKASSPFRTAAPRGAGAAVFVPPFLLAFVVIGCSPGSDSPAAPQTESPASITIQTPESGVLTAGETLSLKAVVLSVTGKPLTGEPIAWRTSHPMVAFVDTSGVVKSVGSVGPVSITATVDNITSPSVEITVTPAAPAAVSAVGSYPASIFSGNALSDSVRIEVRDRFGNLVPGATVDFAVVAGNGSVSPQRVTTSSSGIASAEFITGQPGTNSLTASVAGLTSLTVSVIAAPVTETIASIEPAYPGVTLASWQPLAVPVIARNATGQVVNGRAPTWSSSDNSVVAIQGGYIVGQSAGSATVTATLDGKTATVPVTVVKFAAIYAGPLETCALTPVGLLYCAGKAYGERAKPFATEVRWTQIDSHGESPTTTCGVTTDARLLCWGGNEYGQLGVGDRANRAAPTQVSVPAPVTSVAVGFHHTCAVTAPGDIYCWGEGDFGQLGNGLTVSSNTPVKVTSGAKFTHVVGGGRHTCALSTVGEIHCWGANELGQLGRGSWQSDSPTPAPVAGGIVFRNVSSRGATTCGVANTAKAYCWGNNTGFLLGSVTDQTCRDSTKPCSTVPRAVATSLTFDAVTAAPFNGCGLTAAGSVHCWGVEFQSTLGSPSGVPTTCPTDGTVRGCATTPLNGPIDFVTLTGSNGNYCGMRKNGGAYCWGTNAENQLGTPGLSESAVPRALGIDPTVIPP